MQQTLFFIPHEWFDGRLLIVWLVLGGLILGGLLLRHGPTQEAWSFLPVWGIVAVVIYFVFPHLEVYGVNPADPNGPFIKQGLAVRGYGVCLLLAIVLGGGSVLWRCRQVGVDTDKMLSLGFWMILGGITGARLFYVIQKSDQFFGPGVPTGEALIRAIDMTKGGLVVYGSLIGGMVAAVIFFRLHRLSALQTADLIAPGMMLGLAIGRVGCLMNGCCYGGVCETELPHLQFPAGSPPYMQQIEMGDLLGMKTIANEQEGDEQGDGYLREVVHVTPDSIADRLGIVVGDAISILTPDSQRIRFAKTHPVAKPGGRELAIYIDSQRQGRIPVPLSALASRSLPVHPTQIYSAINALLLALVLWFYWPYRQADGEVFAMMLIFYSIARFLLEAVRRDEAGLFGSMLTISQWVSIGAIVAGFALLGYVRMHRGRPNLDGRPSPFPQ